MQMIKKKTKKRRYFPYNVIEEWLKTGKIKEENWQIKIKGEYQP